MRSSSSNSEFLSVRRLAAFSAKGKRTEKRDWKDGTRAIILEPHDLLTRLVAAAAPRRQHQLRYFGILSSHAKRRVEVVPCPQPDATCPGQPSPKPLFQLRPSFSPLAAGA